MKTDSIIDNTIYTETSVSFLETDIKLTPTLTTSNTIQTTPVARRTLHYLYDTYGQLLSDTNGVILQEVY